MDPKLTRTAIGLLLDATGKSDWRIAASTGIHPSVLSRYRSGERRPHDRHARALASELGCTVERLMGPAADIDYLELVKVTEVSGPIDLLPEVHDPAEWIG